MGNSSELWEQNFHVCVSLAGGARPVWVRFRALLSKELERARQYREKAAELLALREKSTDTHQQATLIELATLYHRMAEQLEESRELDIEPSEKRARPGGLAGLWKHRMYFGNGGRVVQDG